MPEQAPTLRDMIRNTLSSGITYRELEERAVDPGSGATISRGTFNKIALGKLDRMPVESHLRAIAAGLRAPYESVRQGAIAQWLPAEDAEAERAELVRRLLDLKAKTAEIRALLGDDEPESESA
jgi:hypothetical protein